MKHIVVTECFDSIPISSEDPNGITPDEADELSRYRAIMGLEKDWIQVSRMNRSLSSRQ